MSRTAARNQSDLARLERAAAHEFALGAKNQNIRMGCREAVKTFFEYRFGAVDQLLHERPPVFSLCCSDKFLAYAFGIARELCRKIDDELFERPVLLVVTKVGHRHRDGARVRFAMGCTQSSGVRAPIGFEERRTLGAGQMANLEDGRDMLRRNWHQIRRISNLGHERAVFAQCRRKLQPSPGRTVIECPPQDDLVIRDVAVARPAGTFACIVLHELTIAIAALSRATATGATESVVSPVASSGVVRRISAAASPQSETSTPRFRPASTVRAISASTAGLPVSLRSATVPRSRAAAIVYW